MAVVCHTYQLTADDMDADVPDEAMGTKEKIWVQIRGRRWLLKYPRGNAHDDVVSGEDWAEWLVHRLAYLLGVPAAIVSLATMSGARASVCRTVTVQSDATLVHGNELLQRWNREYDSTTSRGNGLYTPANVKHALEGVLPPTGQKLPDSLTAYDTWAGFLVLDAWTAGMDRHHENWAAIERGGSMVLAPSFDHGTSLGAQERDDRRARLVADRDALERWAERGKSRHFAGGPSLVQLADSALALASREAQRHWLERLASIEPDQVRAILEVVPRSRMSEVAVTFCEQLLDVNRRRMLDASSRSF